MNIFIIAAMATNRVIGLNNALPWRLPADLKRFKHLTMGHYLLMGRKTFASINRPLPGRTLIVLTRQRDFVAPDILVAHSLEQALSLVKGETLFIAGGEEVYRQTLPLAHRLYLTLIHSEFTGDAYFPHYAETEWVLTDHEHHQPDEKNPYAYSFLTYIRPCG
ncbi:MAG: dihydrofolate reductase [Acidobacteriota bacterium]|nr:dihydrofolate reductase [Blastocatellia bacterium]MDW8241343.1 dihydrofolate reductase [Acidobacteriota bacterium]